MSKRELLYQVESAARLMTWADVKIPHTRPEGWGDLLAQVSVQEKKLDEAKKAALAAGISENEIENAECKGTDDALDTARECYEEGRWDD